MTFHWKFQEFREKIPKFLCDKISSNFLLIKASFLFCVHSTARFKILSYKIVFCKIFVHFPWGLLLVSDYSNLNKIKKAKIIKPSIIIHLNNHDTIFFWVLTHFISSCMCLII